jgi:hypothetical protein
MNEFAYPKHLFDTIGEIVQKENDNGMIVHTVTATLDNGEIRVTVEGHVDDGGYLEDAPPAVFRLSSTGGVIA